MLNSNTWNHFSVWKKTNKQKKKQVTKHENIFLWGNKWTLARLKIKLPTNYSLKNHTHTHTHTHTHRYDIK